jgi:hypothetical protein
MDLICVEYSAAPELSSPSKLQKVARGVAREHVRRHPFSGGIEIAFVLLGESGEPERT